MSGLLGLVWDLLVDLVCVAVVFPAFTSLDVSLKFTCAVTSCVLLFHVKATFRWTCVCLYRRLGQRVSVLDMHLMGFYSYIQSVKEFLQHFFVWFKSGANPHNRATPLAGRVPAVSAGGTEPGEGFWPECRYYCFFVLCPFSCSPCFAFSYPALHQTDNCQ